MNVTLLRTVAVTTCTALALILAGCDSSTGDDGSSRASGGAASAGSAGSTGDATTGSAVVAPVGPLDQYLQGVYGSSADGAGGANPMENLKTTRAKKTESLVAACMAEQGFDYTPFNYSGGAAAPSGEPLDVQWGTRAFAEKYGYGATTDPGGYKAAEAAASAAQPAQVDPNELAVAAMSAAEKAAYNEALYGVADPDAERTYEWQKAGCQGKAEHESEQVGTGMDAAQYASLQADISALQDSEKTDPKLADLNARWASCMSDAGYGGLAAVGDAENAIYDEVYAVSDAAHASAGENVELTDAQTAEINATLAAMTPREISTAVADIDCRTATNYDKDSQTVSFALQQAFVDSHKTELDAWLAAATEARS